MKEFWVDGKVNMTNMVTFNYTSSFIARSTFFYLQSMGYFHCDNEYYTKR